MSVHRLSPLHDLLPDGPEQPHANWPEVHGMRVPPHLGDPAREMELARSLALADASFLPRMVVKGPRAAEFLRSQQVAIPDRILQGAPLTGDGLVIRTGGTEFFLEDGIGGNWIDRLQELLAADSEPDVYPVLRQDAALILGGQRSGELFRHVSGHDFISQPHDDLVFTPIAGVSCSVLRQTINGFPAFRLWTDGTYGIYTWHTLLEIARELGGDQVGAAVFFPGLSQREAKRP